MDAEYMTGLQKETGETSEDLEIPQIKMKVGKYQQLKDEPDKSENDIGKENAPKSEESGLNKLKEKVLRQLKRNPLEDQQEQQPATKVGKYNISEEDVGRGNHKNNKDDQSETATTCKIDEENLGRTKTSDNSNQTEKPRGGDNKHDSLSSVDMTPALDETDNSQHSDSTDITTFEDDFGLKDDANDISKHKIPAKKQKRTICTVRELMAYIVGIFVTVMIVLYVYFSSNP